MKIYSKNIKDNWLEEEFGNNTSNKIDIVDGINKKSFHISWSEIPSNTKSICIVFDDYEAIPVCGFTWIHWLVADIDPSLNELDIDASRQLKDKFVQGKTSWSSPLLGSSQVLDSNGFGGCAPPNCDHEYRLTIYALSEKTNLQNGFGFNELMKVINKYQIDKAEIFFNYKKLK